MSPQRAPSPVPRFTDRALVFLRALDRHNDREWFRARRERYESDVRAPMVALVERLSDDFRAFAPELVASPRTSIYRIYRDTRFSQDKRPFKTNIAAVFPRRGLGKHDGAGLYLEISPKRVLIAGGIYAPSTAELQCVRAHLAQNLTRFRSIIDADGFKKFAGRLGGDTSKRVPRGFASDHPAAEFLKMKQFLVGRAHTVRLATSPRFYTVVLETFRHLAPFIRFLNEPLGGRERSEGRGP